jgi:hypothetical protein
MDKLETLTSTVREYTSRYGLRNVNVSQEYDLKADWALSFPNAERAGCYCFYDADDRLLLVGKSSFGNTIGNRIMSRFRNGDVRSDDIFSCEPKTIITVGVEKAWEAPSLEEFLIARLNPSDNIIRGTIEKRVKPAKPWAKEPFWSNNPRDDLRGRMD